MKIWKFFAAGLAALATIACGPDTEDPQQGGSNKDGLKVTVSTYMIASDGVDAAQFTVSYNGTSLLAEELTIKINGENAELPGLSFKTTTAGTYNFEFIYKETKSEIFTIEAINVGGLDLSPIDQKGLSLAANTTVFQIGVDEVLFTVRYNGEVIDPSKVTFYDYDSEEVITMATKEVTDIHGKNYNLAVYEATEACAKKIWAARNAGPGDTRNNPIMITAVEFAIPSRALDPQPANTSFVKRSFITQFTGTECGFCPYFIAAFHALKEDAEYKDTFVLAAVHNYSTNDPMYIQEVAKVGQSFGVNNWPTVLFNMYEYTGNLSYLSNITWLQARINKDHKTAPLAGISANIAYDGGSYLVARATVKAAADGNYRIGAWLVEDDIYEMQYNNFNACPKEVDLNTHEAAVRIADSNADGSSNYLGHPLGNLKAGDTADHVFVMELLQSDDIDNPKKHWVTENCRLVFFVTVEGEGGGYYVTNAVSNDSISQTINFEYQ